MINNSQVYISPKYIRPDTGGDGGIRRVTEAQHSLLPEYGFTICDTPQQADILAIHAGSPVPVSNHQKVVSHCHGLYWSEYKWGRWAEQINDNVIFSLRIADQVTAPSNWVADVLKRGMWLPNVTTIPHGVDCDVWKPSDDPRKYILWNKARLDAVSDPAPLQQLALRNPEHRFVSTFGVPNTNVQIIGIQSHDHMPDIVSHAAVYLSTTRETFGINTLEAMACGVPILGLKHGALPELIEHKVHGWLADDIDSLHEGLEYCFAHRSELGHNARELAKTYTWRKAVEQYASVYTSVVSKGPKPKITILVTTYNLEKYIGQCITSVLEQSYEDYEIIVVDDCSSDASIVITEGYTDPRVISIKTPYNMKPAGAFNYGLDRAKGEYVVILDGDNYLEPGSLAVLSSALDQHRDIDIVYGRVRFVNEDGSLATQVAGSMDGISGWPTAFDFDSQLTHKNQIPSTCMYRKRIYDRVGGYRHRAPPAEDADFWCRAASFGANAVKVTDAVTFNYRMRGDSMSHTHRDWDWHKWYPWVDAPPFGAVSPKRVVSNYELDKPPKISVIIPCGPGHDTYLLDALDSVYAQTFKEWECILVNDTGNIGIEHVQPWVRVFNTEFTDNDAGGMGGVSHARNIGLAHARGQAVLFLDADDFLNSKALELMWNVYKRHGGYVYSDIKHLEENRVIETPNKPCEQILKILPHAISGLYPNLTTIRFDETMECGEDWDYVIAIHNAGYCGTRIPEPLINYRVSIGTRRQELIRTISLVREKIKSKWGDVMGCSCGKGGGGVYAQVSQAGNEQSNGDMVLLEYTGAHNSITFTGHSTGAAYKFGTSDSHKVRYVYAQDAERLLERTEFRVAPDSS